MKILITTLPAYGHVFPLMPFAVAARDAGHDVAFATTDKFVPLLESLGFSAHDAGITIDDAVASIIGPGQHRVPRGDDGRPDLEIGATMFIDVIGERMARDVAPLLTKLEPDMVVVEQYDVGSAVVARGAGLPTVCHSLSPRGLDSVFSAVGGRQVERLWSRHAAGPVPDDLRSGDAYLDIFPEALQPSWALDDPARRRMRPIAYAAPGGTVPEWLGSPHRPLVYLTLGTIVATDEVLRPAIDGLAELDVDVLLALGSATGTELGALPANVHVESFVDQAAVLPHADLVVHHGGSGTILGALAYGTPQLLLPQGADQFFNADAMAAAGLAAVLEPPAATAEAIARHAAGELRDRRTAVDTVRDEIASMPHPTDVVDELASLVH